MASPRKETYTFANAIVRKPGRNLREGISTAGLGVPNYELARQQHDRYVEALEDAGIDVITLEPLAGFPDGYFVEDVALILPEVAVIARPGAPTRLGEAHAIVPQVARHRTIERIVEPGTLDGGDVLVVGRRVLIGISQRTNGLGAEQLGEIVERYGYQFTPVNVDTGLHLKSSVNWVGSSTLLVTQAYAERRSLSRFQRIVVDPGDEYAANVLWVNNQILMPRGFPRVHDKLEALDLTIVELDVSEARKMDGGLTCMSIRF